MIASPHADLAQAVLTVDLGALQENWRRVSARAAPAQCAAAVKADAYGVGLEQAVAALAAAGCESFFVAHVDEALRARKALRAAQASARIFLLNGFAGQAASAEACLFADAIPVASFEEDEILWARLASARGVTAKIALMFDTGMNRLGYDWRGARNVAERIARAAHFDVRLIASHFVSSDAANDPLNAEQIARFESVRAAFPNVAASLANSSGVYLPQRPMYDVVRPGYALYGGNPTPGHPNPMKPVVRLRARILQVREVEAGASVGYGAQWTARRRTRLVVIGLGYADGLPRNSMATDGKIGGEVIVAGVRCPFAGRVSMDLTTIDATDVPTPPVPGDWVELLGDEISIDDLGARSQTIGYEILTNLGRRYARVYV